MYDPFYTDSVRPERVIRGPAPIRSKAVIQMLATTFAIMHVGLALRF